MAQFLVAIPLGLFIINAQDPCPYYANNEAQKMFGDKFITDITYDELITIYQPYCLETGATYPIDKLPIKRALRGENNMASDIEIRHKEQRITREISAQPIYDDKGNISYVIAAFQDITQRKKAESERTHCTQELAQNNLDLQQAKEKLSDYNATLEKKLLKESNN